MKRTSVILVLSGIFIAIYFYSSSSDESANSPRFSKYVKKTVPKKNIVDISRDIANQADQDPTFKIVSQKQKLTEVSSKSNLKSDTFDLRDIQFGDERIKALDSLHVVPKEDFVPNSYKVIDKRNTFYIVESEYPVGDSSLTVVAVQGSNYLGVATGILMVELYDYSQRDFILEGHAYQIYEEYEHLNRVFYKFENYEEAKTAYKSILGIVPAVELEILQYERSER